MCVCVYVLVDTLNIKRLTYTAMPSLIEIVWAYIMQLAQVPYSIPCTRTAQSFQMPNRLTRLFLLSICWFMFSDCSINRSMAQIVMVRTQFGNKTPTLSNARLSCWDQCKLRFYSVQSEFMCINTVFSWAYMPLIFLYNCFALSSVTFAIRSWQLFENETIHTIVLFCWCCDWL